MFWLLLGSLLSAQPDAVTTGTLPAIKQAVLNNLRRLPNYTCTETIERTSRSGPTANFENLDRVRLEVGFINGKELFGWPGGGRLDEQDLRDLIGGTVSNGDYALVTMAVFGGRNVKLGELRRETRNGRPALRGDFSSPREGSNWVLTFDFRSAPTGYHGSFWVASDSLQLFELEMTAEDVPAYTGYEAVSRDLQLGSVRIGGGDFVLPSRAELRGIKTAGPEVRNTTTFTACRQYTAESTVSFGPSDLAPQADAAAPAVATVPVLPRKLLVSLLLDSKIDSDLSAVGDPFTAHLAEDIKQGGRIVVPKGVVLHGRLSHMGLAAGHRYVDFAFLYFETAAKRIDVEHRRNDLILPTHNSWDPWHGSNTAPVLRPRAFYSPTSRIVIPPGYKFMMQSEAR